MCRRGTNVDGATLDDAIMSSREAFELDLLGHGPKVIGI